MNTQRNYKDTVYRMLFKEPDNALSLYNSLTGTAYTDESMLEFNTLENAIYMGMIRCRHHILLYSIMELLKYRRK